MRRADLVGRLSRAIATYEGWFLRREQAEERGVSFPTRAQRNCNPGNLRWWRDYPRVGGYVSFLEWARQTFPGSATPDYISKKAIEEGWAALTTVVSRYVDGVYTGGASPTLYEMFAKYAPSADNNEPRRYAEFVAAQLGIPPDKPLKELIDA